MKNRIQKFIDSNADLIDEYEAAGNLPVTLCVDDIVYSISRLQKNIGQSINIHSTLKSAFKTAIKNEINIIDSIDSMQKSDIDFCKSSTQQYFKEINDIYNRYNNDHNIEYCPENREKLIEMNLKTVVHIAKRYQGLGLSLNDLISAGNLGLVVAWDKFDPNRSKLKDEMIESVSNLPDPVGYGELYSAVLKYMQYGDVKKKFESEFNRPGASYSRDKVITWINNNIYNARFSSIATMWIRAYILIEIDNNSRIVKKPKSEIYKDKEESGAYSKEITTEIDAPITSENGSTVGDVLYIEDDSRTPIEVSEAYDTFRDGLDKLLTGVKTRDRNIFLKKFGIGLPRPMLPKEIAEQEGLSIARISQIFQSVIEQMQKNQIRYNIDGEILFDAIKKIY